MKNYLHPHPSKIRRWALPAICLFLVMYFFVHMIFGTHGLVRQAQLNIEIEEARQIQQQTTLERERMRQKVYGLSPEHLDLDMLDEAGREILNLGEKGDFIILNNGAQTSSDVPSHQN